MDKWIAQAGTIQWPAIKPLVQRCVICKSQNHSSIVQVLTDLEKLSYLTYFIVHVYNVNI